MCYFDLNGSKDLFKKVMPSDSALKLHCFRAEYILEIALKSCSPETHENTNEGWELSGDNINVKWEENISGKKSLSYKNPSFVLKCTRKECTDKGRGCVSCWKKCRPCTPLCCKCDGKCNNPHNDGGSCTKCCVKDTQQTKEMSENYLNELDLSENNSHQEYISDSEGEEEFSQVVTDFTTYFPDNGCGALVEFSPSISFG